MQKSTNKCAENFLFGGEPGRSNRLAALALGVGAGIAAMSANAAQTEAPANIPLSVGCSYLNGLRIDSSKIALPTSGAQVDSAQLIAATASLPAYCYIQGRVLPVDPAAPPIRFAIGAPADWNGMSWQLGGGSLNGTVPSITSGSVALPNVRVPLAQNYVTFAGDSGHDVNDFTWWFNEESFRNFAHQEIKKTHDTAMAVLEVAYGQRSSKHYWQGRSQGGRGGLEAVTQYPRDFDGVAVQVALADFSSSFSNRAVRMTAQIEPDKYISPEKGRTLVANEIQARCDRLDGAADGVINDYFDCNYSVDPATWPGAFNHLMCDGGGDLGLQCLSKGQIQTLELFYGGFRYPYPLAYGRRNYAGWGTGWENGPWLWVSPQPEAGSNGNERLDMNHTAAFSGTLDPNFSLVGLSAMDMKAGMLRLSPWTDLPPDISGWIRSGGKLIMTTSASDTSSNPRAQMALYERWVDAHGLAAVRQHVKYYILPHQDHGPTSIPDANGVPIAARVDLQGALIDWVEKGVEPGEQIVAYTMDTRAPFQVQASKPICLYPMYPKYGGSGPLTEASSYSCATPNASVKNTKAPKITGVAKLGNTLEVNEGNWSAKAPQFEAPRAVASAKLANASKSHSDNRSKKLEYSYQWLRDGAIIYGANRDQYRVGRQDLGAALSVMVTASVEGLADGFASSDDVVVAGRSASH